MKSILKFFGIIFVWGVCIFCIIYLMFELGREYKAEYHEELKIEKVYSCTDEGCLVDYQNITMSSNVDDVLVNIPVKDNLTIYRFCFIDDEGEHKCGDEYHYETELGTIEQAKTEFENFKIKYRQD